MAKAKPWQLGLFVVAAVALGLSLYMTFGRSELDLADTVRMVDVNTGEVFHLGIGKGGATIPGRNPRTQDYTLLPVVEEEGRTVLVERYAPALREIPGDHAAVEAGTRVVKLAK